MDIVSEINRISGAKADIRSALAAKKLVIPEDAKFSEYSGYIDRISGSAGTKHSSSKSVPEGIYCSPELYALYVGLMDARLDLQSSLENAGVTVPSGSRITDLAGIITDGYNPPIYETEYYDSRSLYSDPDQKFPDTCMSRAATDPGLAMTSVMNGLDSWEIYMSFDGLTLPPGVTMLSALRLDNVPPGYHYPSWIKIYRRNGTTMYPLLNVTLTDTDGNSIVSTEDDSYHGISMTGLFSGVMNYPVDLKAVLSPSSSGGNSHVTFSYRRRQSGSSWIQAADYEAAPGACVDWGNRPLLPGSGTCYVDRCYIRSGSRWLWSLTGTVFAPPDVTGV